MPSLASAPIASARPAAIAPYIARAIEPWPAMPCWGTAGSAIVPARRRQLTGHPGRDAAAGGLDLGEAPDEVLLVAVPGVVDLQRASGHGHRVELAKQVDLRGVPLGTGPPTEHRGVAGVGGEDQVGVGEPAGFELSGDVALPLIPAPSKLGYRSAVHRTADLPARRARGVHGDVEARLAEQVAQDDLAHRGAADVAGADDGDVERPVDLTSLRHRSRAPCPRRGLRGCPRNLSGSGSATATCPRTCRRPSGSPPSRARRWPGSGRTRRPGGLRPGGRRCRRGSAFPRRVRTP